MKEILFLERIIGEKNEESIDGKNPRIRGRTME